MIRESPAGVVTVRDMAPHDAAWSAGLHRRALATGLFPALGRRFLRRYHRAFIESPFAFAFVASVDGVAAGFVLGMLDPGAHKRETVRRHGVGLALVGLLAMVSRPSLLVRFGRTRLRPYARGLWRHLRPGSPGAQADRSSGSADLCHIAVEDSMRGRGLGALLVDSFVTAVADAGSTVVQTTTVDRAGFYESLGWTLTGAGRTFDGVTQHQLVRRLDHAYEGDDAAIHHGVSTSTPPTANPR